MGKNVNLQTTSHPNPTISFWKSWLETNPRNYEVQRALKRACDRKDSSQIDQIMRLWGKMLKLAPDDRGIQHRLVEAHMRKGDMEETIRLSHEFILQGRNEWWSLEDLDEACQEARDSAWAVEGWKSLLEQKPLDRSLWERLAKSYERNGQSRGTSENIGHVGKHSELRNRV